MLAFGYACVVCGQGLTVDMDKGLLCKLSYINRINVPVYRGRTPLSHAEIEVRIYCSNVLGVLLKNELCTYME